VVALIPIVLLQNKNIECCYRERSRKGIRPRRL